MSAEICVYNMYTYICMYVICVCMYLYTFLPIYNLGNVSLYTCLNVYIDIACVLKLTYIHSYIQTYIHTCIRMHICV